MDESETTHAILREIREQLRKNQEELAQTRTELVGKIEQTNHKLEQTNRKLDLTNRHLTNMEARFTSELSALRATITEDEPEQRDLRERVERCERDIAELRERG